MIKFSTLLLFLFVTISLNAQNINIPDANFKKALLDNNEINTNGDGEISESEATAITGRIDVSNKEIYDLTGIEYFENINELLCTNNHLTTLDLSNNTELIKLECSWNRLINLDISKNTLIKHLSFYDNQLANLDISNNKELILLNCMKNQLINLDIRNNIKIKELFCNENKLKNLELSNNTLITNLHCSNNQITSLDLRSKSQLVFLSCDDNQLSNLDLKSNTLLTSLRIDQNKLSTIDISNNTELKDIVCRSNQLSKLDISNNLQLTKLNCYNNELTSLDISQNTKLRYLYCNDNKLSFGELSKIISYYPKLTYDRSKDVYPRVLKSIDEPLDLSSDALVDDNETTYKWVNIADPKSVKQIDKGIFTFPKSGNYSCWMTNPRFPELTLTGNEYTIYTPDSLHFSDSNFKKALLENSEINTDGNDEISILEALAFDKILDVSGKKITSLQGIEFFANITGLMCRDNKLNHLDINNNKKLTQIDCSYNKFYFTELLSLKQKCPNFKYTPQNNIGRINHWPVGFRAGLYTYPEGTTTICYNNKNEIVEEDAINIENDGTIEFIKEGKYYYILTNPLFPELTLRTKDINIYSNLPIEIPDVNFKKALVENSRVNTNGDTEISVAEAATKTNELSVVGKQISDLSGIEYFINITGLDCSSNLLEELDLSQNRFLKKIYCDNNQIKNLDFIRNTELIYLDCRNNQLTNININQNLNLNTFNCGGNNLLSLNVKNNTELTNLYCWNNQLSNLDLTNNLKLISLNCDNNNFTNINITKNENLTSFLCIRNQLNKLNISNNKELTLLNCGYNQITELDISNNIELTTFNCESNTIKSVDFNKNTKLKNIDCSSNQLTTLNVSNNTTLTTLDCNSNYLLRLDISDNVQLNSLSCMANKFPFSELSKIRTNFSDLDYYSSFSIFNKLEESLLYQIDYSSEVLIDDNETNFKWYRQSGQYHEEINEEYVKLDDKGVFSFLKTGVFYCKMTNPTFPDLTLRTAKIHIYSNDPINIPDANFKKSLLDNPQINLNGNDEITVYEASIYKEELNVANLNIVDLTGIKHFINITHLDCKANKIVNLWLGNNKMLVEVNCSNNKISSLDIRSNQLLSNLNCSYNELSDISLSENNSQLGKLNIDQNRLPLSKLNEIKALNPKLIEIEKYSPDYLSRQFDVFREVDEELNYEVDYGSELTFDSNETTFKWTKDYGMYEIDETSISTIEPGVFKFLKSGIYHCEMTNSTFPDIVVTSSAIKINKKVQEIIFVNPPTISRVNITLELNATASSGLEVNFEIISGDASLNGNYVTFHEVGTVEIKTIQEGNDEYEACEKTIEITVDFATGIEDVLDSSTQIYPNPVVSEMAIKFAKNEKRTIRIFDLHGRVKLEKKTSSSSERLNLSNFKSGMYLMKIQANNETFTYKIIKK